MQSLFPLSSGAVKGKEKQLEGEKSPEKEGNNGEEERRGILHTRWVLCGQVSSGLGDIERFELLNLGDGGLG